MSGEGHSIAAAVRRADPDRYLSTLYAPETARPALLALYAFNAEIAAIRDRVREPLPGEIRLQWWRDALAGGPEAAAGHPVAEALSRAIVEHQLPIAAFDRMLDARVFDLYDDPMPSRTDLEGYCGETAGALIQLSSLVLAPRAAADAATAAGHAGCAQAITGLLRLLPIHRARGQCYVPRDLLDASGTTRDALIAGEAEGGARAVAAMAALAREHDTAFRQAARSLPDALRPAFLPAALARSYLDRIETGRVDPLRHSADISILKRHWALLTHAMRGLS